MSSRNNGAATGEGLGRTRLIESGLVAVELHVPREDARPEHPGVVEIVLSCLDQENLEVVVQVGQPSL